MGVVAFYQVLQLMSSMEVEVAPVEVDLFLIEVERGVVDWMGSSMSCGKGSLFILSYRGVLSPIEVEVGLVLLVDWCCELVC